MIDESGGNSTVLIRVIVPKHPLKPINGTGVIEMVYLASRVPIEIRRVVDRSRTDWMSDGS